MTNYMAACPSKAQDHDRVDARCRSAGFRLYLIFINFCPAALGQTPAMQRVRQSLSLPILALALVLAGPGGADPAKGTNLVDPCADDARGSVWIVAGGNPVFPWGAHFKYLYYNNVSNLVPNFVML